jgi:hypothetical protein
MRGLELHRLGADNRIGAARLDVPKWLPSGVLADPSRAKGSLQK